LPKSLPVLLCCPLLEGRSGQAVAYGIVGPCGVADTVLPDLVVRRRRADALLLLLPEEEDGGDVTVCSLGEDGRDLGERQRVARNVNLGPVEPLRVSHGCGNGPLALTVPEIRRLFDASSTRRHADVAPQRPTDPHHPIRSNGPLALTLAMLALAFLTALAALGAGQAGRRDRNRRVELDGSTAEKGAARRHRQTAPSPDSYANRIPSASRAAI
jgi:hypothetical protein